MQRILRRWRQVAVEEAASEQLGPPAPGVWGELYLREVMVRMAVLSSLLLPLAVPLALTATLPPPFPLPTPACLEAGVCQWRGVGAPTVPGCRCCWEEAGRVVVGLGSGWLSLNVVLSNRRRSLWE